MAKLSKWTECVHANSVAHGWWEADDNFLSKLMLIVSEVAEAAEEFRNGHKFDETYHKIKISAALPGFQSGEYQSGWKFNSADGKGIEVVGDDVVIRHRDDFDHPRVTRFTRAQAHDAGIDVKPEGIPIELADVIIRVLDLCGRYGIDIEAAIREKHAYNLTREHRHGGKKA